MKRFTLVYVLVLNLCPLISRAQNPDTLWTLKLPGGGYQKTQLLYLIQTQDNNYVAAGLSYTEETQEDVWAIKFTANGEILWNKTYQTDISQLWLVERTRGLAELSTGELVIFAANQEYNHYLLFTDTEGNISDITNYIGSEDPYYVYTGIATDDSNLLVAGENSVYVNINWRGHSWFRKLDSSGNMIWEWSLPPVRWQDRFTCIGKLPDGGFILAGSSDTPTNSDEILLVRIDAQGDTLWTRRWGTTAFDRPKEIVPTPDGGFIVAATKSYMSSFKGLLLKLDAAGNEEWMQTYNDYDQDEIHSAKPTLDGGYIIAGEHKISSDPTRINFWVMKTDQQGNKIQSFELAEVSDFYINRGRSVLQCADGSYIAVGQTITDGLIVKFSPNFGALGIEDDFASHSADLVLNEPFPNPFSNSTTISWTTKSFGHAVIKIYDFLGREVRLLTDESQQPGEHQVIFDATGLPTGIYCYQLQVNGAVETRKMILLK